MKEFDFKDLLQEGLRERVKRYVETMDVGTPDELTGSEKEQLIYSITGNAIGELNMFIDLVIRSACYTQVQLIRWARKERKIRDG